MSADVINLRRARKAKTRADHDRQATANRTAFGRTKAEKAGSKVEQERSKQALDGHHREKDER